MEQIAIGSIPGFRIGQAENTDAATGCTVIISGEGAVGGVDVRGASPGTRDTDGLTLTANRKYVHAVFLAGGSAFGLDAAGGVMRFLEERRIGRDVGVTCVPNVCAAILFDLKCGGHRVRPDQAMAYRACESAFRGEAFQSGNHGAGTGATLGKARGPSFAMKGGVGAAAFKQGPVMVGAVAAVNCVGDVLEGGRIIAGTRSDGGQGEQFFADSEKVILENFCQDSDFFSVRPSQSPAEGNTVLVCIITNARLDKAGAARLARAGHNGIARCIRPAHSLFDGDTVFALCSGAVDTAFDAAAILACRAVEGAIIDGVKSARALCGYPACQSNQ
jgi:L-aminopeptidase/D-esterase-like protein